MELVPRNELAAGDTLATGGSLAGRIRRAKAQLEGDREKPFALPGYEGVLEVVYRRLPIEDVDKILNDPEIPNLNERHAQFLIEARVGIYGLEEDGTRTPLEAGRPLGFDDVALMANPDAKPASLRTAVLEVFDGNDHELRDHGDAVYRWTKGASAIAGAIAGGS